MVLVGDQQETDYRMMQRSTIECLATAPVAGMQSYLRSFSQLTDANGPELLNPYGCTRKPLRNMKLWHTIKTRRLLESGKCKVFRVPRLSKDGQEVQYRKIPVWLAGRTACTWLLCCVIVTSVYLSEETTWIGTSSSISIIIGSIAIRIAENCCLEVKTTPHANPNAPGAVILLGPRNSCLIFEGERGILESWVGFGLHVQQSFHTFLIEKFIQLCSLSMLLFAFITIPNGSTYDQVAFICINLLGQLNNVFGRLLNAMDYSARFEEKIVCASPTRTHVYGVLLRRYGNGAWVDEVNLLPGTGIWQRWREGIADDEDRDPKALYDLCQAEFADEKYPRGKATRSPCDKATV